MTFSRPSWVRFYQGYYIKLCRRQMFVGDISVYPFDFRDHYFCIVNGSFGVINVGKLFARKLAAELKQKTSISATDVQQRVKGDLAYLVQYEVEV